MSPMAVNDPVESMAQAKAAAAAAPSKPWQSIKMSSRVARIGNPIREVIAGIDLNAPPSSSGSGDVKPLINLGLGDPSVYGNFPPPSVALDAIEAAVRSGKADGYPQSTGYAETRQAVADYFDESATGGNWRIKADDVVMTHGASGALEMALTTLCGPGSNVLLPRPLFTAYETMVATLDCEIRYYDLLPDQGWQIDLASVDRLADDETACWLICNPSNPCGSNWSESHLREIAAVAARRRLLVVSDEVYAGLAWSVSGGGGGANDSNTSETTTASTPPPVVPQGKFNRGCFTPYASICGSSPALIVGALSKRFLAPGWRLGWLIVHDPQGVCAAQVRDGLGRCAFRIQGPSSTLQRAVPAILRDTPDSFFRATQRELRDVGEQLCARLERIPGLRPVLPQGAMYLMCGGIAPESRRGSDGTMTTTESAFEFQSDKEFVTALHREERVFILPGACFRLEGYMRFVTTVPLPLLMDACDRLEAFCDRHRVKKVAA